MSTKALKKQIAQAVYKATSSSMKPPKEKHVKRLCLQTFSRDDQANEEMVRCLYKRLEKDNWAVVLKALMVFHRCFRDGDQYFMESLRSKSSSIFALRRFSAVAPQGNVYTLFVRKYAKYLEEKVSVLRLIGLQFEKTRDACKSLPDKEAFKRVPKLQSQLNALLNCKMRAQHVGKNLLIVSTYMLLLKDSLVLYPILNDGVIGLIDRCFKMRKKEAQRVLEIYTLFVKETDALITFYDVARTFAQHLPQIHRAKTTLIDALQQHISKMPDDDGEDLPKEEEMMQADEDIPAYTAGSAGNDDESEEPEDADSSEEDDSGSVPVSEPLPFDIVKGTQNMAVSGNQAAARTNPSLTSSPSFAVLTAQQQQPRGTTSQGWAVFDDGNTPAHLATNSAQRGNALSNNASVTFGTQLDADPFDTWASDFSTSPATPVIAGGAPAPVSYQQKADSIKNMLGSLYHQPTGPTGLTSGSPSNPFADPVPQQQMSVNPFLAAPTTTYAVQQPAMQPQPAQPYNPFL
eukprot:TRINITY_DN2846_c0_g2_i1.p1 TRINITY_DN2846_c0_g2~~TRINITY_DN2846_c0_g2_i1.p1  ORF type:complete len:517 (+),score=153.19 TRINITY_DN2846_c0_g2_i1:82-1632(+)